MVPAMDGIPSKIALFILFIFSTTCHEAAHAWAAHRGGDDTAYALGHVTLDPMPHIARSPWGMIALPLFGLFYWGFPLGYASVPFDPRWGRRYPTRQALMSLAGPMANFTLALFAAIALRVLMARGVFHPLGGSTGLDIVFVSLNEGVRENSPLAASAFVLSWMLYLNLMLGVFNLVPFPPLDGSGVVEGLSPRLLAPLYDRLREIPGYQFLGWIAANVLFEYAMGPVARVISYALGYI
jgi:Zn-dependent protease